MSNFRSNLPPPMVGDINTESFHEAHCLNIRRGVYKSLESSRADFNRGTQQRMQHRFCDGGTAVVPLT